jgi:hypothetical protein
MKKKNNFQLPSNAIPGGEGFNALPTAFIAASFPAGTGWVEIMIER